MEGYSAKVSYASKELSAKEKIAIKDTASCISLDEATQEQEAPVIINYDYHAVLDIHNEKAEGNKDYHKIVVADKDGTKYITGSDSFLTSMVEVVDEMIDAGETEITLSVCRRPSKNYKGKEFLHCGIC